MHNSDCLGIVLAGGKSTRMGQNKANLQRGPTTMLSYSKKLLADIGIQNIVVSGDNYDLPDEYQDMGPLSGIYTVINQLNPKAIMVIPIDLPLLDTESLIRLKQTGEMSQRACFYINNRLPLYMPCNGYTELFFKTAFNNPKKGPSFKQLFNQVPHRELGIKNTLSLFNCNTPQQWQQAQTILRTKNGA